MITARPNDLLMSTSYQVDDFLLGRLPITTKEVFNTMSDFPTILNVTVKLKILKTAHATTIQSMKLKIKRQDQWCVFVFEWKLDGRWMNHELQVNWS